ncbi:unnamed protein product, partial [Porites evermanni]
ILSNISSLIRAEYWKSQPRKLCEFCKCWITDNKPSVEFHERGKKHKENVQRRIEEVRKKSKEVGKAEKQLQMDLAAIEAAALKAYQKDLNIQTPSSKSETTEESTTKTAENETCSKGETTAACFVSYEGSLATMTCTHGWNIWQTPEGYYYYYNTATQVTQWESPSCLLPTAPQNTSHSEKNKPTSEGPQVALQDKSDKSKTSETKKEEAKSSPYGQWTTVQTFEPLPDTKKENSSNGNDEKQVPTGESVPKEVKFKERSTPKITFRSDGAGSEVAFKKRKLNPGKKRNVRQTDPNKIG